MSPPAGRPTQSQGNGHFIETARASGEPFYDAVEPLSENPSLTADRVAEKTPRPQDHLRGAASDR
jgi:hypothetical protein